MEQIGSTCPDYKVTQTYVPVSFTLRSVFFTLKPRRTLRGSWAHKLVCVPCFLLGNRIQPPWLPQVWNRRFKQLLTGKGGDVEIREKQPGNNHTTLGFPQIPKLGFRSAWALNLQMFKLVLEMAEEPEIKLPTCAGSSEKEESSRETSISALLTTPKPLTVDHSKLWKNKLWKILKEMGIPDHLTSLLRNLYSGQEATVRTGHGTTYWFQIGKRGMSRLYIVTLLI